MCAFDTSHENMISKPLDAFKTIDTWFKKNFIFFNSGKCNCICQKENVMNVNFHYGRTQLESDQKNLLGVTIDKEKIFIVIYGSVKPLAEK